MLLSILVFAGLTITLFGVVFASVFLDATDASDDAAPKRLPTPTPPQRLDF